MPEPTDPTYLTTGEAAAFLGLSVTRINQFLREGRLRFTRMGSYRMIKRQDLEQLKAIPRPTGKPIQPKDHRTQAQRRRRAS